jgi:hypothetical protein
MQRGDCASGWWQKLIETLLTGLMQPSAHEVVRFGGTDMTIAPWNFHFWHKVDIPRLDSNVRSPMDIRLDLSIKNHIVMRAVSSFFP